MSHPDRQRIHEVFEEASARPPEERESFVAEACAGDAELQAEVVSLLEHDERAPAGFLRPAEPGPSARNTALLDGPDPLIGQRIGQYEIKGVIASGGMGTVYEAKQQKPHRIVALKVMKAWAATRATLRRFEFESEILARLTHPHIAQVYEAGTHQPDAARDREGSALTTALPYFAMEYVPNARTITAYAAQENLTTRARLELFAQVCDAVHFGHRKGVIHRDLKPANILVDEAGQVKVIDFGVARATDLDVAVTTLRTDVGQLLGTVQYMSPEQCAADPLGLDTRSDVYSLGVVLYELLSGQLPYDVKNSAIHVAARVICEQEPVGPRTVDRRLRGDLEAILLKALQKDREKRYESAAALTADIQRHLKREPIVARSPGMFARLLHGVARHPILTTLGICLAILASSLTMTAGLVWVYYEQPYEVKLSEDGRTARLNSRAGRVIRELQVRQNGGIRKAKLVSGPQAQAGGQMLLISFSAHASNPFPGGLCAFDANSDLEKPIWARFVNEQEMPTRLLTQPHFNAAYTGVFHWQILDVFPDRVGMEIVAVHDVRGTTQAALRVYDLNGELLYQVWMDFLAKSVYWMSEPRLLVMVGNNGSAYWETRGHPEVEHPHPRVVFSIRLQDGLRTTEYLSETPGTGPLDPVWYRCLRPAKASDWTLFMPLTAPPLGFDPDRFVHFRFGMRGVELAYVDWVLDANGSEMPNSRRTTDAYKRNLDILPDPGIFYLGDLPPVIEEHRGSAGKGPQ